MIKIFTTSESILLDDVRAHVALTSPPYFNYNESKEQMYHIPRRADPYTAARGPIYRGARTHIPRRADPYTAARGPIYNRYIYIYIYIYIYNAVIARYWKITDAHLMKYIFLIVQ